MNRRALITLAAATVAAAITERTMIVSFASDDLAPILAATKESNAGLSYGQGVIASFDRLTGENTVTYRGALLRNLPLLSSLEALILAKGDVVALLAWRGSHFILGRITPPGVSGYGDALSAIRDLEADATGSVTTTSTGFVSLSGGPAIGEELFVGPSGRLEVTVSAWLSVATNGSAGNSQSAIMSFELIRSGAAVRAANDIRAVSYTLGGGAITTGIAGGVAASRKVLLTGLTPGAGYSLEARYRCEDAGQPDAGFTNRVISAVAL